VNKAIIGGVISSYGVRLSYTQAAKPQLNFSLTLTEGDYHVFVPVQIVGPQAEHLAETLEPGDYCLIEGKLSWKKEQSKLVVVGFGVERLSTAGTSEHEPSPEYGSGSNEDAINHGHSREPDGEEERARAPKARRPRLPKHVKEPWVPSGLVSEN
jgi:single-stranded DNA-binding protein